MRTLVGCVLLALAVGCAGPEPFPCEEGDTLVQRDQKGEIVGAWKCDPWEGWVS